MVKSKNISNHNKQSNFKNALDNQTKIECKIYFSFDQFDWTSLEDKDNKYKLFAKIITERFKSITENNINRSEIIIRLFSNTNNKALFYSGVEQEHKDKYSSKVDKLAEEISGDSSLVKTPLPGKSGKKIRLLSVVIYENEKTSNEKYKMSNNFWKFYYFPLVLKDTHKK